MFYLAFFVQSLSFFIFLPLAFRLSSSCCLSDDNDQWFTSFYLGKRPHTDSARSLLSTTGLSCHCQHFFCNLVCQTLYQKSIADFEEQKKLTQHYIKRAKERKKTIEYDFSSSYLSNVRLHSDLERQAGISGRVTRDRRSSSVAVSPSRENLQVVFDGNAIRNIENKLPKRLPPKSENGEANGEASPPIPPGEASLLKKKALTWGKAQSKEILKELNTSSSNYNSNSSYTPESPQPSLSTSGIFLLYVSPSNLFFFCR